MIYALAVIVALAAFIAWRITSVARGARKRDEAILARLRPIADKLETGAEVTASDVEALAAPAGSRPLLYEMLDRCERLDLFPAHYLSVPEQAKAKLAYWMMHPNELGAAPAEMAIVDSFERTLQRTPARFVVVRYRMPDGHWAGADWILGLAGPFVEGERPFLNSAAGFSRASDRQGSLEPAALVDWYVKLLEAKLGSAPLE